MTLGASLDVVARKKIPALARSQTLVIQPAPGIWILLSKISSCVSK